MSLTCLPCQDSEDMAFARRRELDISRRLAAELGHSAVIAAEAGEYKVAGEAVHFGDAVRAACRAKLSIPPDAPLPTDGQATFAETHVRVSNETTLAVSKRLAHHQKRPLALNFANGICPGGGFLDGSRAQEEGLCRSSALYLTLRGDPMYVAHARRQTADSTDWAIYSPDVPVFRDDDGTPLKEPWPLSFITCAAPVAHDIGQRLAGDLLERRIHRVLAIARAYKHFALVLGAWGCGAFGNDPHRTARDFRSALEGQFAGAFSDVHFAITDWSSERRFLGPFRDVFP